MRSIRYHIRCVYYLSTVSWGESLMKLRNPWNWKNLMARIRTFPAAENRKCGHDRPAPSIVSAACLALQIPRAFLTWPILQKLTLGLLPMSHVKKRNKKYYVGFNYVTLCHQISLGEAIEFCGYYDFVMNVNKVSGHQMSVSYMRILFTKTFSDRRGTVK